jgi:ribosomal protein S18 acetylase RimI-like enzyme
MYDSETLLDNPIWNALSTRQSHLAVGGTRAKRFDSAISPLSGLNEQGLNEQSDEAYAELAQLLAPSEIAILFLTEAPRLPQGWKMLRTGLLTQMICRGEPVPPSRAGKDGDPITIEALTARDVPEMLELIQITEPGPFARRTIELGGYLGIRQDGRLAAMAGQRLAPPGFTEVSAVCTHPDFRGLRFAQLLVATVAQRIHERGETPLLTLMASNTSAFRVYEAVGFEARRTLELAVITPNYQPS